ncbi:MAG TPA: glucose 1-dehydrogenase [Stellaceae bacterium]|nr:glucose 1-dehydrogenase [Stellaceae bacterium]
MVGQKALVTGANSGIGEAVAVALAGAGADVAVNYVARPEDAEAVAGRIRGLGSDAMTVKADVSDEAQVVAMFRSVIDRFGRLDILVANAGLQRDARLVEMTLTDWNTVIGVNLTGQFLCCREAVRQMEKQGVEAALSKASGKIICMSSVHQQIPWAGHVNYAASKGGIMMMMQSIAQEVAPLKIRVNGIAPGAIRTPINHAAWGTAEAYRALMTLIPYARIGEPDDIGRAAVWLASDEADYVTGTTLFADGGMTLYPGFATGG